MNFELKQHFQIESARFLPHLPKDHPCSRVHGHSFKIILTLSGPLDPKLGWVMDYHEITKVMKPLLQQLDHQTLNEVSGLSNPTSELLAKWIYEAALTKLPLLKSVIIMETPTRERPSRICRQLSDLLQPAPRRGGVRDHHCRHDRNSRFRCSWKTMAIRCHTGGGLSHMP